MNVIRDTDHAVTGWNITKAAIPLSHKFDKNSTGVIQVKDVLFFTENTGLIHFDNSPDGKSSIYHFNISSRGSPLFQHNFTTSIGAKLLIEPTNRQWCIISNSEQRVNMGKLTKDGKIEDGIPVSIIGNMSEGLKIEAIKSACFLPMGDKLIIIN